MAGTTGNRSQVAEERPMARHVSDLMNFDEDLVHDGTKADDAATWLSDFEPCNVEKGAFQHSTSFQKPNGNNFEQAKRVVLSLYSTENSQDVKKEHQSFFQQYGL